MISSHTIPENDHPTAMEEYSILMTDYINKTDYINFKTIIAHANQMKRYMTSPEHRSLHKHQGHTMSVGRYSGFN